MAAAGGVAGFASAAGVAAAGAAGLGAAVAGASGVDLVSDCTEPEGVALTPPGVAG